MNRYLHVGLVLLATSLVPSFVFAQESELDIEQQRLIKQRDEKLAKAFLKNGDWITDYDAAKKRATESGKLIFGYFTRSYAP
ncbi:MAG: hypothetical protein KDB80_04535 [Planctomycetes bacterium]|nr:hypothetical protein [Planctomycetota bacterium]